jgi:cystathionine beta-synthase
VCDSGNKYLSKMFNDYWMADQGFLRGERQGNLRDLIARSAEQGAIVAVDPEDTLLTAHSRMKLYDLSQLPVLDGGQIVGLLDESDLLLAVSRDETHFHRPVRAYMTRRIETVAPDTPLDALLPILDRGLVAIVCEDDRFLGLITRFDVLNYLRRQLR